MQFPSALMPTATIDFPVSDTRVVPVPSAFALFQPWSGPPIADDYGGKAILDYAGEPLFAELVILRHFQSGGWSGVWIDTYRRSKLDSLTREVSLTAEQCALLDRISARAKSSHGCFDVFAWSDDSFVFAESKRFGRDRIRPSQVHWLAAALDVGVPLESLLVVEWGLVSAATPHPST